LLWVGDQGVLPDGQISYVAFGPRLLEREPQLGKDFMVAYLKGVRQLAAGKTERNVDIVARGSELAPEFVQACCWTDFRPDGRLNVDSMLDFQNWALAAGLADKPLTPEQFWDPTFVDYANEVLGPADEAPAGR
jgi:hypothetical protein